MRVVGAVANREDNTITVNRGVYKNLSNLAREASLFEAWTFLGGSLL